jgi:hypothetical protein
MAPPDRTWVEQAACHHEPARLFIGPKDDSDVHAALSTCQRCPVSQPCLATALNHRVEADTGIWGGTTEEQRREIRRGLLEPEVARNANRQRAPSLPETAPRDQPRTQSRRPGEVPRLAAPEVTVARDKHGDYVSANGRVLIFRVQGDLPWVLTIDDQIIGASRTVTEARRTAWTTLHDAGRATARAQAHGQGARRR